MPEEERRISPAVVIGGGLLLGLGATVAVAAIALAAPPTPPGAEFKVSDLIISPTEVTPGQIVTISCTVTNIGTEAGDYTARLGGDFAAEIVVELAPGESKTIAFEVVPTEVRDYSVSVNGLYGSFTAVGVAKFYMPPILDIWIDHVEIVGYRYHRITFACLITNMGNASGAHTVEWHIFWNGNEFSHGHKSFTLGPGESYQWKKTVDVDFHRCHTCTAKLYGDWEENNFSEAYLIEGDVIIGNLIEEKHSEW